MTDRAWARRMAALIRQPAFIASVTVVVLALIAGGLAWQVGHKGDSAQASPSPAAGGPSGTVRRSDDPWASLGPVESLPPQPSDPTVTTAVLTATGAPGPVVPTDTAFQLASADTTPASVLAARLTVEPALALAIAPDAGDRIARLTPSSPLLPGAVYRFALHGPTGELLDSWAFQASQPLRIVGHLPEGESTDVPVDTGIELTFDQDGVIDAASHVTITPATPGRFEQHGRTIAFVADKPLKPATIYRVVVSPGITVASSGEATADETRFQFETAATSEPTASSSLEFQDLLFESATAERPLFGLWSFDDGDAGPPKTAHFEVFQLADMPAAIDAFRSLRTRPTWSRWSDDGLIDTSALNRVVSSDLRLESSRGALWARLPNRLPAGWYLVQDTEGTRPDQAVLQVTDVAGYLAVSTTRTLVWANDLKGGGPVAGATVAVDADTPASLGRTDANGLTNAATPGSLLPDTTTVCSAPCEPVVTVRTADGRAVFMATSQGPDKYESYNGSYYWSDANPGYWTLLHTDRNHYRSGDTVNLWGVVRARATGTVPATVTVQLTPYGYDDDAIRPPVASVDLKPGETGAFTHSLPLTGLADGYYTIELKVGSEVVASNQFVIGPLAKPAYRLDIVTGRRVYIAGDHIKVSVGASFFEGTPVPGVPIRISTTMAKEIQHVATTDATGTAVWRTSASVDPSSEGMQETIFDASPARAEEGEIASSSRETIIFPSSQTIDVTTSISGGRVRVSGGVHVVDVPRLEAEIAAGRSPWELDPRGRAVGGATVTIRFYEQVPIRTKVGTEYDFIEKKVVPVYEDQIVERAAGTIKVRTTSRGTFSGSVPATVKDHDYRVVASVRDSDGHTDRMTIYADRHPWSAEETPMPTLLVKSVDPAGEFGVGDRVDVTMTDPTVKQATGDGTRYLFMLAQGGIRDTKVQSSPRFVTTFKAWAIPDMQVDAVRFTGNGYVGTVATDIAFRQADRGLQVDLTPNAARYAPGDQVTIAIRTRDAAGAPVAATVVLRAIDEKLYSIGAATADDPLAELYAPIGSGIVSTSHTHRIPRGDTGGGDTTGGGGDDRDDFRDSLLFTSVDTDRNGRGTVSFKLSDDLTSWRVSASGITTRLQAGAGSVLVPVGLPFFVDASLAPQYLAADRPSIPVRVYGSAVTTADPVTIRVTVPGLLFDSGPIRTTAFTTRDVPLPPLQTGRQTITIRATSGTGTSARTDALTRTFDVVATRLTLARSAYVELPAGGPLQGGDGRTTVLIADASAARYLSMLTDLAAGGGARLDRGLAADIARSILARSFGTQEAIDVGGTFDPTRYQSENDGGLALLPYSSSDLELSTLVALMAPDRVDRSRLASYLRMIRSGTDETRERQIFALAGLAALGDPLIPAIRTAAADPDLTDRERLMLGLGAAAIGDATTARAIATSLIADRGERAGDQARLRVGSTATDITEATALMAVLLADLGDHRAPQFWAYVADNPGVDRLDVLPAAAYVGHILERTPVKPAAFSYTLKGTRSRVDLEPGRAFELDLSAPELATLSIEPITGTLGVTTSWQAPIAPSDVAPDPDVRITRTSRPAVVGSDDLVAVTLHVTFSAQAAAGCHQVTELVPSGLTPVGSLAVWPDTEDDGSVAGLGYSSPYDQSGSQVFFCAEPNPKDPTILLRYFARVVTPGTYVWEPAIAPSRSQTDEAALTAAGTLTIH